LSHHLARFDTLGLIPEQSSLLLTGLWVWLSAFGGDTFHYGRRAAAGVIGLLLTSMHMTLLGALLAMAPRQIYDHHLGFGGLTALQDQHLGGAVMILIGGIAYLTGGLWLTVRLLRQRTSPEGETA
jgi:putative membrane protein